MRPLRNFAIPMTEGEGLKPPSIPPWIIKGEGFAEVSKHLGVEK